MYSGYSGHVYSGHSDIVATSPGTKYICSIYNYIQVRYSGHSDIVARKWWPKVATISEVHCISLSPNDESRNVTKTFITFFFTKEYSSMVKLQNAHVY